jgi:hypothetical protein
LFWKEVREDMIPSTIESTIWDELPTSNIDTMKLEHLFESRAKDLLTKVGTYTHTNDLFDSFPSSFLFSLLLFAYFS